MRDTLEQFKMNLIDRINNTPKKKPKLSQRLKRMRETKRRWSKKKPPIRKLFLRIKSQDQKMLDKFNLDSTKSIMMNGTMLLTNRLMSLNNKWKLKTKRILSNLIQPALRLIKPLKWVSFMMA